MKTLVSSLLLAGLLLALSASAQAQLVAEPSSVTATVGQGDEMNRTVTLTNEGTETVSYCLSFGRPLDHMAMPLRLSGDALASACGTYGEVLYRVSQAGAGTKLDIYGLTMTPDGRLLAADGDGDRTHELTQDLQVVRSFFHPLVDDLEPFPATRGVTYNTDTETLWWMNKEGGGAETFRVLLLEGDLDGTPTGRRIEVPVAPDGPPPFENGSPVGLSYEASTKLFYFVDFANDDVWAVDTLGNVADGYPIQLEAYPGAALGFGLDTHYGGNGGADEEPTELWLEAATNITGLPGLRRIVAADRFGRSTVPKGGEPLETPLPDPSDINAEVMSGEPLRSVTDPNAVLYYPFGSFITDGVLGIRPHPLPPLWLALSQWDGTLEPGESTEVVLTFSAGSRAVGSRYEAALQVFDAATDEALEVPLALEVTEATDTALNEEVEPGSSELGTPYPNPSGGPVVVPLTLAAAQSVTVAIFDVLGREVAVLHDGRLAAGTHRFALSGRRLPAGFYVVRVTGEGLNALRGLTLVR